MDCQMMKKKKKELIFTTISTTTNEESDKDRISALPDELIHQILSFSNAKLAVQTSILSKRWKLIWTTLPFLNFIRPEYDYKYCEFSRLLSFNSTDAEIRFFENFLSHRNHQCEVLKLNLGFDQFYPPPSLVCKFLTYTIAHNIQEMTLDFPGYGADDIKLSSFSSTSIRKLTLGVYNEEWLETENCWHLPALTILHLISYDISTIPESYLICLPSLQILSLHNMDFPYSFSLPALTTLSLALCTLPPKAWYLPSLKTLTLEDVEFPQNMTEFFHALFNLQNLTLNFMKSITADWVIDCPQLVNLEIRDCTSTMTSHSVKIIVLAPKIRNFSSVGFFPITFGFSLLENVSIKSWSNFTPAPSEKLRTYYRRVIHMFPGLGSTRILTLDLATIGVLSAISTYFDHFPSPFYNLKYVKVPQGYEESMPNCLRSYLLGGSPKATIVSIVPQDELIPQTMPVCQTSQKLFLEKPLGTLASSECNDLASSSRKTIDIGLWQGHEVKSEFVGLLDCIVKRYPETFDYFTTNSKKTCTIKLNMLCTTVKAFIKTSMTEVDAELIAEYRALFTDLERSFNVKWLIDRLNYIAQLQFSQPLLDRLQAVDSRIDDTKSRLQNLQALRTRMMTEIHRDVGNVNSDYGVCYIGDDLFLCP